MKALTKSGALALALFAASAFATKARVTEAQARAAALAKVPGGIVKSHELETEHGRLIWTYDIKWPGRAGVTEVHVDAKTGKVIAVKNESAADEANEVEAEKRPSSGR